MADRAKATLSRFEFCNLANTRDCAERPGGRGRCAAMNVSLPRERRAQRVCVLERAGRPRDDRHPDAMEGSDGRLQDPWRVQLVRADDE
jgi:hypothetical protein